MTKFASLAVGIALFESAGLGAQEAGSDQAANLAKQLANPISSLISVPFQSNYDGGSGPTGDGWKYTLNVQPVVPISISKDWNVIVRAIVPVIAQKDLFYRDVKLPELPEPPEFPGLPKDILKKIPPAFRGAAEDAAEEVFNEEVKKQLKLLKKELGKQQKKINTQNRYQSGLGDTTMSYFLSPKEPGTYGIIWGVGPVILAPTASHPFLGGGKWGAGPTLVALKQTGGWTVGVLVNHIWSFAGDGDRNDISATYFQPFASYTTKTRTTFSVSSESTYDWTESQWTVPVIGSVSQLLKIGRLPVSVQVGGKYFAEGPSGAPEWGVRLAITLLFPTG